MDHLLAAGTLGAGRGALVVIGVFVGSAVWWTSLTSVVAAAGRHFDAERLVWARRLTGSTLGGCGLLAVARAL